MSKSILRLNRRRASARTNPHSRCHRTAGALMRDGEFCFLLTSHLLSASRRSRWRQPSEARAWKNQSSFAEASEDILPSLSQAKDGGARRDRTDDLKLAKLALSQ